MPSTRPTATPWVKTGRSSLPAKSGVARRVKGPLFGARSVSEDQILADAAGSEKRALERA
jgi:hypothetical protein